jgi:putative addiction module component (TIGR02574 family)
MTRAAFHRELSKMTRAEKLQLVQDLWDSIAEESDDIQLDSQERRLLDQRVAAHRRNPRAAQPWNTVKRRVIGKIKTSRRTA